ncbi:hypothetical protein DCAR_0730306 [Daucus carota subsp. sativus]|uniref:Uncharacterized protein n=1 Tax=Daucus carota subsp. sativus TaxID=79200 RepID=A0A161X9Q1_DAUCS|nr:hypothetical protein DCAR_0730306 [Daucus carota subsp. sativus]
MESSGLVAEKFCKLIDSGDTEKNEMTLPRRFCEKYGSRLVSSVHLKVRNGYVLHVEFEKNRGMLKGVLCFFKNFELKGGELLVFEYFGRSNINVYILGANCSEINYPNNMFQWFECLPSLVTFGDGGWRCVEYIYEDKSDLNEIILPPSFLERCGRYLEESVTFVLSNGQKFGGTYCHESGKLSGLNNICYIGGNDGLRSIHMLLFAFHTKSIVTISAFDEACYEIIFPGTPLSKGYNSDPEEVCSYFEITIEPKHMLEDCHVVDISNDFVELCSMWDSMQTITVYSGNGTWMLLICNRYYNYCWTIESGWQLLRDGLQLGVGDKLVFECPKMSFDHFSVRVIRKVI